MTSQGLRAPMAEAQSIAAFLALAGIPGDARILDVPCGIGRRALALAEEGFHVTAIDPNAMGVEAARTRIPQDAASRLRFSSAPKEALPGLAPDERFDAILCMDHAVGRESRAGDVSFLARLADHAALDGLLVLDLLHRDFCATRPRPFSFHVLGNVEQHEFRAFDPLTGSLDLTWKFYEKVGEDLRHRMDSSARMRLFAPHEASELLREAGWRVDGIFGGWERETVSADRRKLIVVARRARP